MFDNLQDSQNGGGKQPQPTPPVIPGQEKTQSPTGAVMPGATPATKANKGVSVEDMFSDTSQKEKPAIFQPKAQALNKSDFNGVNKTQMDPYTGESLNAKNRTIVFALMLISLMLVGVAGWYAYKMFFTKYTTTIVDPGSVEMSANEPENDNVNSSEFPSTKSIIKGNDTPLDTDGDGLSDNEEMQLGTNPLLTDTDSDGLFDREEVKTYKTDPLDPDTDKDGYSDGQEVKGGYNPKGEGSLYK